MIVVIPLDLVTPSTYSTPPSWVPFGVVENLNGWALEWVNVYVVPTFRISDFLWIPSITNTLPAPVAFGATFTVIVSLGIAFFQPNSLKVPNDAAV